jgi:hypothetical protein
MQYWSARLYVVSDFAFCLLAVWPYNKHIQDSHTLNSRSTNKTIRQTRALQQLANTYNLELIWDNYTIKVEQHYSEQQIPSSWTTCTPDDGQLGQNT